MITHSIYTRILALFGSGALTALMIVSTSVLLDPERLSQPQSPFVDQALAA